VGERHSPGMDGVAAGAGVGWGMVGGFALGGGVDEVEGFAEEEAGPAMEKNEGIRKWKN